MENNKLSGEETVLGAAYDIQYFRQTSAGWVIRDQYGVVKYWAMARLGHAMSPLEAEYKALVAAVQCVIFWGYKSMVFEGDCEVLIRMMLGGRKEYSIITLCNDIISWSQRWLDDIPFVILYALYIHQLPFNKCP
ncbi:uncharacterized protein LOC130506025 [Raphanus sativus]|uniref:Uncharacterized protein LOC130506025 n=1 Tax=Raphanus sativus TaxID=3726 RepID=A0A9W3CYC2_RAPSA|nr:uncharacterized protein LOC130506025 [Raphanus sativus]